MYCLYDFLICIMSKNNFMKSIKKFNNLSETDIWNSENIYHLKTDITRISKLIYHYEIYKKIISLPGDVIECGVFKGI